MKRNRRPYLLLVGPLVLGLAACAQQQPSALNAAVLTNAKPIQEVTVSSSSASAAASPNLNPTAVVSTNPVRTINVHGVGRASETPDQATVTMGVETNAATAQLALRENNAKATELIALLKSNGVEDRYIQTSQLSVYPQFDNQGRKIVGYQVSNIVTATVTDVKKAGAVIDAAAGVAGDSIRIQSLSFGLSDSSEPLKRARTRAVEDARTQAEQLAAAAGVKVGALRTISSSSVSSPPILYQQNVSAKIAASDSSVPLEAGSAEVTAEVNLVFDLVG